MSVFLTADLHLGHKLATTLRGFQSVEEHDAVIITGMKSVLSKRDKLIILGDVAFSREALRRVDEIPCEIKTLVLGNHDRFRARIYLEHFHNVLGAVKERKFLLTHVPIHPQELLRFRANLHGHIHKRGKTGNPSSQVCLTARDSRVLPNRFFNVGVEYHDYKPVRFRDIEVMFPETPVDD